MMSRKTHSEIIDRALESHGIKQQGTERKAKALRGDSAGALRLSQGF